MYACVAETQTGHCGALVLLTWPPTAALNFRVMAAIGTAELLLLKDAVT